MILGSVLSPKESMLILYGWDEIDILERVLSHVLFAIGLWKQSKNIKSKKMKKEGKTSV